MGTYTVYSTADASINAITPDYNYGSQPTVVCAVVISGGAKTIQARGIYNFDVNAFVGYTIDSAKLVLEVMTVYAQVAAFVCRCTRPSTWVEPQVTHNSFATGSAWTTPGGDYDLVTPTYVGFTTPAGLGAFEILGLKDFVTKAIATESGILSQIMRLVTENPSVNSGFAFYSRENSSDAVKLVIEATPPVGGTAFGAITSDTLVPASWAGGSRRFGAVPSTEVVTVGSGARRWGAVPSDESVPADSDWTT